MNNQNAKADEGKPKLSLVPTEIINCIARCREYGTMKYKNPDNWKDVEKERYIDAAYRHWIKYVADNNSVDEESGLSHLWHCACNLAFLCEFDKVEREKAKINDDISKLNKPKEEYIDVQWKIPSVYGNKINADVKGNIGGHNIKCVFYCKETKNSRILENHSCVVDGEIISECKNCPYWDLMNCECEIWEMTEVK